MLQRRWISIFIIGLLSNFNASADSITATLAVKANVVGTCEAGSTSTVGSFGQLDFGQRSSLSTAISIVGLANSGAIRIKCTNKTTYKILIDYGKYAIGTDRYLSNGLVTIKYNLYTDANHQTLWDNTNGLSGTSNGQETWLPIYALIPAQSTPAIGVYADTVNVTIVY